MVGDEYEGLRRLAEQWVRVAATPQYRQMVEAARQQAAQGAAADRAREQARRMSEGAASRIQRDAARAVEQHRLQSQQSLETLRLAAEQRSRQRVDAAKTATVEWQAAHLALALQPVMDQHIKAARTWVTGVERLLANPTVLRVLQTYVKLASATSPRDTSADRSSEPSSSDASAEETQPPSDVGDVDLASLQEFADSADLEAFDLDAFEAELLDDATLHDLVEGAVDRLTLDHPLLTRGQARRLIVTVTFLGWMATLLGLTVALGPIGAFIAIVLGAAGLDAGAVSGVAGKAVDTVPERFFAANPPPPDEQDSPAGDV